MTPPSSAVERLRQTASYYQRHVRELAEKNGGVERYWCDGDCDPAKMLREALMALEAEPEVERVEIFVKEWYDLQRGIEKNARHFPKYDGTERYFIERQKPVPPPKDALAERIRDSADAIAMITPPGPVSKAETILNEAADELERRAKRIAELEAEAKRGRA